MDERKAYWFEQPYMPQMKNIAVAPVILEDGRLSFCVPGDDGPPWSGVWNLTGKVVLDGYHAVYLVCLVFTVNYLTDTFIMCKHNTVYLCIYFQPEG